jgi:hypothetical protein
MWQTLTGSAPVEDIRRSVSPRGNSADESKSHRSSPDTAGVASFFEDLRNGDDNSGSTDLVATSSGDDVPANTRRKSIPPPPPSRQSLATVVEPTNSDSDDDLDYFRTGDTSSPSRPSKPTKVAVQPTTSSPTGKFKKNKSKAKRKSSDSESGAHLRKSSGFQLPLRTDIMEDVEEVTAEQLPSAHSGPVAAAPEAVTVAKVLPRAIVKESEPELSDVEFSSDDDDTLGETGGNGQPMLTLGSSPLRAQAAKTLVKLESKSSSWTPRSRSFDSQAPVHLGGSHWRPEPKTGRKESSVSEHHHFGTMSRQGSDESNGDQPNLRSGLAALDTALTHSVHSSPAQSSSGQSSGDESPRSARTSLGGPRFPEVVPSAKGKLERTTVLVPRSTGLGLQLVTADGTTWVSRIGKGSPAEECGQLFEGDVLVSINGVCPPTSLPRARNTF